MTTLYVTEYANVAIVNGTIVPVGHEPANVEQVVSFTSSTQSAAFAAETRLVRLYATGACHLAFGTNPTATTSKQKLAADMPEWRGVMPGHKVAAVDAV